MRGMARTCGTVAPPEARPAGSEAVRLQSAARKWLLSARNAYTACEVESMAWAGAGSSCAPGVVRAAHEGRRHVRMAPKFCRRLYCGWHHYTDSCALVLFVRLCSCALWCGAQGLVAVDQACMGDLPKIHAAMLRVRERHPPTFT